MYLCIHISKIKVTCSLKCKSEKNMNVVFADDDNRSYHLECLLIIFFTMLWITASVSMQFFFRNVNQWWGIFKMWIRCYVAWIIKVTKYLSFEKRPWLIHDLKLQYFFFNLEKAKNNVFRGAIFSNSCQIDCHITFFFVGVSKLAKFSCLKFFTLLKFVTFFFSDSIKKVEI